MSDNKEFWNDELVYEFVNFYDDLCKKKATWTSEAAKDFKELKSKELSKPPKNYEIVSYKAVFLGKADILFYFLNGGWQPINHSRITRRTFICDEELRKNGVIYSVKRLSDKEVFTVGDTITDDFNETTITSIITTANSLSVILCGDRGSMQLAAAKKQKKSKPLFTTDIDKIAGLLSVWSWGKEIPSEMIQFEKFIKRGLSEIQQKINDTL